ncbi:hypothetical protein Trydic_g3988 [Trypoxylus dichotomus]
MRDFKLLQEDPQTNVSGAPTENNVMIWNAVIFEPPDTPFEDGTFKLTIEVTELEYPNTPPTVRFFNHMFHLNVYADGDVDSFVVSRANPEATPANAGVNLPRADNLQGSTRVYELCIPPETLSKPVPSTRAPL